MISIILTSYNRPALLHLAIQSILDQTCSDWELVIADDNSKSEVDLVIQEMLRLAGPMCSQIKFWKSDIKESERKDKARFAVNINASFPMTTGKYISYLTDDNVYYPEFVARVTHFLDINPDIPAMYVSQMITRVDWETGELIGKDSERIADIVIWQPIGRVDHTQVIHHREWFGEGWPDGPEFWQTSDGHFFASIIQRSGQPLYPLSDILIEYKITDTSMCRQPIEVGLRKLRGEYWAGDSRVDK